MISAQGFSEKRYRFHSLLARAERESMMTERLHYLNYVIPMPGAPGVGPVLKELEQLAHEINETEFWLALVELEASM